MDVQQAKARFSGPMVSVATPFTEDFGLDLKALERNIKFMIDHGLKTGRGVLLAAAAGGEFPMLSTQERKDVIEASVQAAGGAIPIAASIQFNGTGQVIELANFCVKVGAELGQLSSPYYYPPPDEDIYHFFKDVSDNSDLPIMIYNNWWNTLEMNVDMVARLEELDNVVALKWSAPNSSSYAEGLQRFADKLAIIDNEGQLVWSRLMGAIGYITHVGNFWPEYAAELWELTERHEYDTLIARLARFQWPFRKWCGKVGRTTEGEGPFIKVAMEAVGLPSGPARPPARPVSQGLRDELHQLFEEVGVPQADL